MSFPTVRGAAPAAMAGTTFPTPQGPRTPMASVTPHQLSPMGRQLLKAHLMQHAMRLHHQRMQMHTHPMELAGAGPAPGITNPFQPSSPMLGTGPTS